MRTDRKAKPIFIAPDGTRGAIKSMCGICKQYRQVFGNELKCPLCGSREEVKESDRERGQYLKNEYSVQPMLANKKGAKKQKDSEDLPAGAYWVSDETHSSQSNS